MKPLLISLLLFLSLEKSFAQVGDITLSKPLTMQNIYSNRYMLGSDQNYIYVGINGYDKILPKTMYGLAGVTKFIIVKYDIRTLNIVSQLEVPVQGWSDKIYSIKGSVYLVQQCSSGTGRCCTKINLENGTIQDTQPIFSDISISLANYETGITSDSSSFFAVRYEVTGDGRIQVQYKVFGLDLKEQLSKSFYIPFKVKGAFATEQLLFEFSVDKEKDIYFRIQRKNDKTSGTDARFNNVLLRYSPTSDKVHMYDVNPGNDDLTHSVLYNSTFDKKIIYAFGYFSSSFTQCMDGIFYMMFDKETGEVIKITKHRFPQELVELMKKDNLTNGRKICYIGLDKVDMCMNDGVLLIGEIATQGYLGGNLVIKLDKNDSLEWCTYLPMEALMGPANINFGMFYKYSGFHRTNSMVSFMFNDKVKNYIGPDKSRADEIKEKATSFCAAIDMKNGSIMKDIMWPLANSKMKLQPATICKISDTEAVFIATNELELAVGKIRFK